MPPVVRTRALDRRDAGNDGAAGRPAPEGEYDVSSSSSLQLFASDEAAAAGDQPGGKQLHNLRRQRARSKRYVESSVATAADTSDEEWSPRGGGKKKQQRRKWGGGAKRGGGDRKKKARRAGPQVSHSVETVALDGRLVISRPHAHDVLSGRGGGINAHPGNQKFRDWVWERKESYTLGRDKGDKARICQEVHDLIVLQDPPGRFLMREDGDKMKGRSGGPSLNSLEAISAGQSNWVEIPTDKAMAKISQALREGAPSIREAAKKEQKPKISSRGRTPKRKTSPRTGSVNAPAARPAAAGRSKKKKKESVEETDLKEDSVVDPTTKEPPVRARVFPEVKSVPVPAPIVAPEIMMGQHFGAKVAPGTASSTAAAAAASSAHQQSNQIFPTEILTPDEIAAAEEHFRHGKLVSSPTGRGKEIIMPPTPVAMTQPKALRTESDESRERRTDDDLQQAVEADEQLNHLLQIDKATSMLPTLPKRTHSGQRYAYSYPSSAPGHPTAAASSAQVGTPTPHLLPMSPIFSPTFDFGTSTSVDNPTMSPPNFATMFDSPVRSWPTMNNGARGLPPPSFVGAASGLQRTHSLALSNTASDHGMISSNEVKNVFSDEHDVANSVGSVSGGGIHNHHHSGNMTTKGSVEVEIGSNSRAIISPVLASRPQSEARDVAPIEGSNRSSSSRNKSGIGRSAHSTNSRLSDLSDLTDARLQHHLDESTFYESMREVYYAAHPEALLDPTISESNRSSNGVAFSPIKRSRKRTSGHGLITP